MPKVHDSVILQLYARTPAPCRDYCGLSVTEAEVILNIWQVSFGPHVYPKRKKCFIKEFEFDKFLQSEIVRIFGDNVCDYILSIQKKRNLQNLPTKCFLNIIKYLALKDIRNLSQTSTIVFNRCNMDNIWKLFFRKYIKRSPDIMERRLAENCGWKEVMKQKLMKKAANSNNTANKTDAITKSKKTKEEINSINRVLKKTTDNKTVTKSTNIKPQKVLQKADTNKLSATKSNLNTLSTKLNTLSTKLNTNPHKINTSSEKLNVANKKLNTARSSSILEKRQTSTTKSTKPIQMTSLINLNKVSSTANKKSLPQIKNELKLNNNKQNSKLVSTNKEKPKELNNLSNNSKPITNIKPKICIKSNLNHK